MSRSIDPPVPLSRSAAPCRCFLAALTLALLATAPAAVAQPAADAEPPLAAAYPQQRLSATAEEIYRKSRGRLLQIRTLLASAHKQTSIGSGFLVDADGYALTNYHVVSQYALEPQTYQLEFLAPDGSRGALQLHAIDVANDLAVIRLETPAAPSDYFVFNPDAVSGALSKGERLFAMGNPLDLGFTIVEGTYNGLVENSYQPNIHFTGALNPGMSGGPAVTADNRIAGVNVARQVGGELVSFLVPARAAHALLEKARSVPAMSPASVREDIRRQLDAWQDGFLAALGREGFRPIDFGPYQAAESEAPWFNCWARTNSDERPRPRALINNLTCNTRTSLFLSSDVHSGQMSLSYTYLQGTQLNAFQFAALLSRRVEWRALYGLRQHYTPQQCYENFLAAAADRPNRPVLRVTWCARAYRDFADLYDVSVAAVTQDDSREALIAQLTLTGVSYPNAVAFTRNFLDRIEVKR